MTQAKAAQRDWNLLICNAVVLAADRGCVEVERSAGLLRRLWLFSGCGHDQTFCPFGEWKAVFRRTFIYANLPSFRPFWSITREQYSQGHRFSRPHSFLDRLFY
jgi:hypothetical protein